MTNLCSELKKNHTLAPYTIWRIGGRAEVFYQPANLQDLANFLAQISDNKNIIFLGAGSNVLIGDKVDGYVIHTKNLANIAELENCSIQMEVGVSCAKLAKFCKDHELTGAEFLAGIPGTIGGALATNAGAFGSEIWDLVTSVELIDANGAISTKKPDEFAINYRNVELPVKQWFVKVRLQLKLGNRSEIEHTMHTMQAKRKATQPIGKLTCGSVFRNPANDYAARLIEAAGLKGLRIGGAQVSQKHANFIENVGNATANDVIELMEKIKEVVFQRFAIILIPEVRFI